MKKILIKIIPLFFIAIVSCEQEDTTEGVSRITSYNDIEFVGDKIMFVPIGSSFTDPGVTAFEGEEDVTANVEVSGSVNTNSIGQYALTYSIVNTDGFAKEITRTVIVHPASDSAIDYSGTYTGNSRGEIMNPGCVITKVAPSTYLATDFFGGVYCCGVRNYGSAYKLKTYFYVSSDNTTYTSLSTDSAFGPWDILTATISGTTLTHEVNQDGFGFQVILTKNN